MDADYHENEGDTNMFGGRKRKGRSRFARVVAQKKPVFDPSKSSIKKRLYSTSFPITVKRAENVLMAFGSAMKLSHEFLTNQPYRN